MELRHSTAGSRASATRMRIESDREFGLLPSAVPILDDDLLDDGYEDDFVRELAARDNDEF
jgi:hypothetical protein